MLLQWHLAISDEEHSDVEDVAVTAPASSSKRGRPRASTAAAEEEPLEPVKGDIGDGDDNDGADEDDDEDMDEDE